MQIEPAASDGLVQRGSGGGKVQVKDIPTFNTLQVRQPVDFKDLYTNNLKQGIWIFRV